MAMLRGLMIAATILMVATSAGAYDMLYTGDVAMTHDPGTFGIEGGILQFSSEQWFQDGEREDGAVMLVDGSWYADGDAGYDGTLIPVDARYSLLRTLEIGATGVFLMENMSDFADEAGVIENPLTDFETLGVGDTWLWAKYNFSPEPLMSIRVGYKLPTGEDRPDLDELPTGSGQSDIDGAIMFGVPAGPGWVDASIGYRIRTKRAADSRENAAWPYGEYEFKPGNEVHFFAGYTQLVGRSLNVRLGGDGTFGSDYEGGPDAGGSDTDLAADTGVGVIYLNPGIDYLLGSGIWLGADMHYPIMGKNVNAAWGFGLSLGWGMQ
jgi:hypothetical protein